MPPDFVTDKMVNSQTRPAEYGNVTIRFDEVQHARRAITRPIEVYGLVYPVKTTGRGQAPEPICGWRVSQAKALDNNKRFKVDTDSGLNALNLGIIDAQKGHIMALELGGPDIQENIVPQWAQWQCSGEWRQFETQLKKKADELKAAFTKNKKAKPEDERFLHFHCVVRYFTGYQDVRLVSERKLCFPVGFDVWAAVVKKLPKNQIEVVDQGIRRTFNQQQNETDDQLALRQMEKLEQSEDADFEYESTGTGKKRKIANPYSPPPVVFQPLPTPYMSTVGSAFAFNLTAQNNAASQRRKVTPKRRGAAVGMDTSS